MSEQMNVQEKIIETEKGEEGEEGETQRVQITIPANYKPKKGDSTTTTTEEAEGDSGDDQISLEDFELMSEVGSGQFGKVYKVREKKSDQIFAAKVSKMALNENTKDTLRNLKREVSIISKLNHPCVLKFIGFSPVNFHGKPKPVIITEFVSGGSLEDVMKEERNCCARKEWTSTQKLIVIYGIASAMAYLHENKIIHRDLKPSNILLDGDLFPKIADFGLSRVNHVREESISLKSTVGVKGTPMYIAPEIWRTQKYDYPCDVYAFGIIVYEIVMGQSAYPDISTIYELSPRVMKGERPEFNYPIPDAYKSLIESCWDDSPEKRPTFSEIVAKMKESDEFITDDIEENSFYLYCDYIHDFKTSFGNKTINFNEFVVKRSRIFKPKIKDTSEQHEEKRDDQTEAAEENDNCDANVLTKDDGDSSIPIHCPRSVLETLDADRQNIVKEAETNHQKQYIVGNFFVEGIEGFPQETDLGVRYLVKSIYGGCVDAVRYYCNLLIKGEFVEYNYELAKKYLETQLKSHDGTVYLLYGRALRKSGEFGPAKKYFKKSAKEGNPEGMYEYGKMCYKGEGCPKDEAEANVYFDLSKRNGCYKAYEFIFKQEKEAERMNAKKVSEDKKDDE